MSKVLKKEKCLTTSKRRFTVIIQNKEHGLYISSTPFSAAKKVVSKLCASNKQKKVEFYIREITQGSKKKTYGPYIGYLKKLDKSIKLKEYNIEYNPVVKLKKAEMRGGTKNIYVSKDKQFQPYFKIETTENLTNNKYKKFSLSILVIDKKKFNNNNDYYLFDSHTPHIPIGESDKKSISFTFRKDITEDMLKKFLEDNKPNILKKLKEFGIRDNVKIDLYIPYISNRNDKPKFDKIEYIKQDNYSEITSNDYSNMVNHILSLNEVSKHMIYLNIALQNIGIKECLKFFGNFLSNFDDNLPIISVGSGTAYFEFLVNRIFRREIICVDPNPRSYISSRIGQTYNNVFIPPKFKTVNNLLSASEFKYNDCLLLLNWPNPMSTIIQGIHDYDPYDFNAIIKLKPIGFFIVYDSSSCSGSNELIDVLKNFMEHNNANFKISNEETLSYKLLAQINKILPKGKSDNMRLRIAYYRRKKVRNISTLFSNHNFFDNN